MENNFRLFDTCMIDKVTDEECDLPECDFALSISNVLIYF